MRNYIKFISIFALLNITLFAKGVSPTTLNISAFPYPKDRAGIKLDFQHLSDDIDLFNINKDQKEIDLNYGYLGDSNGFEFRIGYGFSRFITLFYDLNYLKSKYMGEDLKNRKNELGIRVNFYDVPYYIFDAFSLEAGYISNGASSIDITAPSSMALFYNTENLKSVKLDDLGDDSFYFRLIYGNRFKNSILNLYGGFKYSSVDTTITQNIDSQNLREGIIKKDEDLSRDEKSLHIGINYTFEIGNFVVDKSLEYSRIYRSNGLKNDHNHNLELNINISRVIHRDLLIFIGGRLLFNQLNGVVPYAYNRFNEDSFGEKFGYVKMGFVYNFDTKNLFYIPNSDYLK
jgi:hypothetical protein